MSQKTVRKCQKIVTKKSKEFKQDMLKSIFLLKSIENLSKDKSKKLFLCYIIGNFSHVTAFILSVS